MADTEKILNAVAEVGAAAAAILTAVPATAGVAELIVPVEQLVVKALQALAASRDTPITPESILALMPAPIALDEPTEGDTD